MPQHARKCHLTKRVTVNGGSRYCPVVMAANGRIKPHAVIVDGREELHTEGGYYLEWTAGRKRTRKAVGNDATEAQRLREKKEAELHAWATGQQVKPENNGNRLISGAIATYLDEIKLTKKPKTLAAYTTALTYFQESCHKMCVEEITRKDMLEFSAFLRDEKGQSPRSVYNKFENVMTFLKANGVRGLVGKNDWPRFTEEEPEVFERADLDKFFAACDAEERLWFEFFLMTGMREQEAEFCYWSDVKFNNSIIRVTHKPDRNWQPKAYKEREIPVPTRLMESLKAHRERSDRTCNLVFPTTGCKPKMDFLDCCKAIAERAGLNPEDFWLHKFRATFATWHLWSGVDLRTVMNWLGHSDLESTARYLKPSRSKAVAEKVNQTFA
jgi:integrase/recombinase XerD